jgi:hypothetical protein
LAASKTDIPVGAKYEPSSLTETDGRRQRCQQDHVAVSTEQSLDFRVSARHESGSDMLLAACCLQSDLFLLRVHEYLLDEMPDEIEVDRSQ